MSANLARSVQLPLAQALGTATLVPAVAGQRIVVVAAYIVATAASTFNFQSHTTTANKTGAASLAANGVLVLDYNPDGWFYTTMSEALDAVVGGTGPVAGSISYVYE